MNNRFCLLSLLFIIFVLSFSAQSQTIDTLWTKTYWNNFFDSANCVQETADKGFIITGETRSFVEDDRDVLLIKTDSLGVMEWQKSYGGELNDCGFHVLEAYDGGYLISANSYSYGGGGGGIWIIKTDAAGDTLWTYPYSPNDANGFPIYATKTVDSCYAITGIIYVSDGGTMEAFILKLDRDGNNVGYEHYDGTYEYQSGWYIASMPDSGFIVAGWYDNLYTTSHDYWAFRTNKNLIATWSTTYPLTDYTDLMYGACKLDDGLVMVGDGQGIGHALKVDFDGSIIWSKSISLIPYDERNTTVCPTGDGGLIVSGWVWETGHRRDFNFIKLNGDGDIISTFTVGGTEDDHAQFIVPTYDGNYITVGTSYSFYSGSCIYLAKITEVFNSPAGSDVEVVLDYGVTVDFANISTSGETTLEVVQEGPALPGLYTTVPSEPLTYYNITTTATYNGNIEVCLSYYPSDVIGDEANLEMMHYDGAAWVDITSYVDTENDIICGITTSLSPFVIAQNMSLDAGDDGEILPGSFALSQNYPNPFNPSTEISYDVPYKSIVVLTVYNLLGEKVIDLVKEEKEIGNYNVSWDGRDSKGRLLSSGMYFYKLSIDDKSQSKKMLLLK